MDATVLLRCKHTTGCYGKSYINSHVPCDDCFVYNFALCRPQDYWNEGKGSEFPQECQVGIEAYAYNPCTLGG